MARTRCQEGGFGVLLSNMSSDPVTRDPSPSSKIDTSVPHSARIWNYWIGGKDNYRVDREVGDQIAGIFPSIVSMAREDRAFIGRAVGYLAGEVGIRQFLDIGTGLPTADNTHQVAQRVAPESRIVYVDKDPLVLAHARALLTSSPEGACDYIEADLRDPAAVIDGAGRSLDLSQPAALMLVAILPHITSNNEAYDIVGRLLQPLASGSHLVIVHDTDDIHGDAIRIAMQFFTKQGGQPIVARSKEEIAGFFDGLDVVEPGIVTTSEWRTEGSHPDGVEEVSQYAAVARKS